MIDLNKNQLVEGDVKVRCWDDDKNDSVIGYLALIDRRSGAYPFYVWDKGLTGEHNGYDYNVNITFYKNVELIEPKYRVKDFYSLVETLKNEGFNQDYNEFRLHSDKLSSYFFKAQFIHCGKIIGSGKFNEFDRIVCFKHFWRKSWLEEVTE